MVKHEMTYKEDIEKQYEELLPLANKHDSCLEEGETTGFGSRSLPIKESAKEEYWETRGKLENNLAEFMTLIRKAIYDVPSTDKKVTIETSTNYHTGEEYTTKIYHNPNFESMMSFYGRIQTAIESSSGIITAIGESRLITPQIRAIRGSVLSFSHILDLFIPEKVISIEKEVEVTLRLRELGLEKVADELDTINEKEANDDKCKNARNALEFLINDFCAKNGITLAKLFHHNLDLAIKKGLTEKAQQKPISAHYSFVSKIVHKDIEASPKNTYYAIQGIYNIIDSLTSPKETKKTT